MPDSSTSTVVVLEYLYARVATKVTGHASACIYPRKSDCLFDEGEAELKESADDAHVNRELLRAKHWEIALLVILNSFPFNMGNLF